MKRWHYIALAGLGILAIAYVYLHRQELGLAGPQSIGSSSSLIASSSHPSPITWQQVDRPNDGFRVEMPTDVKELQIPAYNESGGTDQVNMIFSNADAETSFSVAWADDPPVVRANGRSPDRVLDMARDDALARTQTTLVTETRNTSEGMASRDIVAHNTGGGVMDTRLIYTGERLYMLVAAFPSSNARREQDIIRFFNSFKITESTRIPQAMPSAPAKRN